MKKLFLLVLFLLVILFQVSSVIHSQSHTTRQQGGVENDFIEGQVLVKGKGGPDSPATASLHGRAQGVVAQTFDLIGWQLVNLPPGVSTEEGLARYRQMADCLEVQPNYVYRIYTTPNDTLFNQLYGMTKISAPAAWDATTGLATVVVANIDTGIDYNHPDLAANMWRNPGEIANNGTDDDGNGFVDDYFGYDFINQDANPADDSSHGTHTAGTIGAVGNNGAGVAGVNWNIRLMALKTHDISGNSTAAAVIAAFNYVTMMKNRGVNIRVTNNSWGGAPEAPAYDQALKDAIDMAGNAGVLHVFAAGNEGRDLDAFPSYPASYRSPSILAVASSTSEDARSGFSNWGVTSIDVAAPGSGILSTVPGSGYALKSGTSMATPHVAGAAALLAGYNATLSAASLKATLINTVDTLPAFNGLVLAGGRINVARALSQQTVCGYAVSPASQPFQSPGGQGSITVTGQATCDWQATSTASWITITSVTYGTGNGTVQYSVAANPGAARSATLTIADKTFSVTQAGPSTGDTDGDGIPDNIEPLEGRNPLVKDNDIFAIDRLFVMQQYRDFLGREADPLGLAHWTNQLTSSAISRAQLVDNFFTSLEFQAVPPITRLYFAYFLRIPDYDGLLAWVSRHRAGQSLLSISDEFAASAEFQARYGNLSDAQFVALLYQNVLGRTGDAAGLAHWTNQLTSGAMTRGQVMLAFSESTEFRGRSANWVFVVQMYVGMLRRAPEQFGFDVWVSRMNGGLSRLELISACLGAPEYHNRFL